MFIFDVKNTINYPISKLKRQDRIGSVSCTNLAPLQKDTISFTGGGRLRGEHMVFAPNEHTCNVAEQNAEPARFYLQSVLDKYVGSKFSVNDGSTCPVTYTTRIKKANSIREKTISAFMRNYCSEVDSISSQILKEFLQYYKLKEGHDENEAFDSIKNSIVTSNQSYDKLSPYSFTSYFVDFAAENLGNMGIMNIDEFSQKDRCRINETAADNINASNAAIEARNKPYIKPSTIAGVKHYANDIVGARIILSDCSPQNTNLLFEALAQAAMDKKLKIISIENNLPDPDKLPETKTVDDYTYASDASLKKLAEISGAEYTVNKSKSGYLSVHINVNLSEDLLGGYGGIFKGYTGEIQILGADVEKLKDVEDLCYKFKDDKNSVNEVYKPFKEVFKKYYTGETRSYFDDYTYALYLHQRDIEPGTANYTGFPSPARLGFKDKIPPELDFNNLAEIKRRCDLDLERIIRDKKEAAGQQITPVKAKKEIKRNGDIRTLKSLISFDIK